MAELAISYSSLYQAQTDLYRLAEEVGPEIKKTQFAQIGDRPTLFQEGFTGSPYGDPVGDLDLTLAINLLHGRVKGTMDNAEDHLERLGDLFGAVADAFFEADSQLAAAASTAGMKTSQGNWQAQHEQYEQYVQTCGPDAPDPPESCDETVPKPTDEPPTKWSVKTMNGRWSPRTRTTTARTPRSRPRSTAPRRSRWRRSKRTAPAP
jgi:hypothetical protein